MALEIPAMRAVLTGRNADVSFGFTRDSPRDSTLNRAGNPHPSVDLRRRDFLVRFCQGAGAMLIPRTMWGITFPEVVTTRNEPGAGFHLQTPQLTQTDRAQRHAE